MTHARRLFARSFFSLIALVSANGCSSDDNTPAETAGTAGASGAAGSSGSSGSAGSGGTSGTGGSGVSGAAGVGGASPNPDITLINPSLFNTVLGRPTDTSIAVSVLANAVGDKMWVEYGTQLDAAHTSIVTAQQTPPVTSIDGEPMVVDITGLSKNTKY